MTVAEKQLAKKDKQSAAASSSVFDADGRRVIRHDPGRLPEILDEIGAALAEAGENLFVYTDRLTRIYTAKESAKGGITRPRGALILHPVDGAHLVELATRSALHERYDSRSDGYRVCDCPRRATESYLSRGSWPELRTLAGIVETPTATPQGRVIDQPGYDEETGLFLALGSISGYKQPPAAPTRERASAVANNLLFEVREFPFVDDTDKSAFLAGVVTSVLRRMLPAAPMIAVTAPTAGTGKTLIAETFAIIATGRRASVLSLGHDEAETEKRLAGVLMAGDACIALDNIERPLKGDLLCQVLTQQFVRLRPLGASGMVSIPTHALIVATGNNLAIVGDLKRRVCLIRMDAGQERPEQRSFSKDHLERVFQRRGNLIRDALTIFLAYHAAGSPAIPGLHPLGGFELWDRMVRRPLVWLGLPDPLKATEGLRDQDPDIEAMRLLFSSWYEVFGNEPKTASDAVAAGMETAPMSGDYLKSELRDALQLVCSEKPNTRRLGYWLKNHRDRICDGFTLKQAGIEGRMKLTRWQVVIAGDGDSSPATKARG